MSHINQTLFIIKPDGVERGIVGKIISQLEDRGLKIVGMKMTKPSLELSEKHYGDLDVRLNKKGLAGDEIKKQMVEFLSSGPVVAVVIEGVRAVEFVKKLAGATAPHESDFGTIRSQFAHMTREHANESGRAIRNLVHASDPEEFPEEEIKLWFSPSEIIEYQMIHDSHVR